MEYKLVLERNVSSLEQTDTLAKELAALIKPGMVAGFKGALGSGKTTLIKKICAHLGSADQVSSPSFVLQHIYQASEFKIEHWDLYRLKQLPEELSDSVGQDSIRMVEWFEKAEDFGQSADLMVCIAIISETEREISVFKA